MLLSGYETVAHRGLHSKEEGIPENSLPSFQRAVAAGVAIELDVHLTKDFEVVVFHDDNLRRMTGLNRIVEDCTCGDLAPLRLQGTEYGIPMMRRVLQTVNGRVPLLIELKDNTFSGELQEKLLELLQSYSGDYMLQSFNPYVIYWLKKNAPRIKRGQLSQKSFEEKAREGFARFFDAPKRAAKKQLLGNMIFNSITKPDFIAYNIHDLTPGQAKKWRNKGYGLLAWTVRTQGDLRKARWLCDGAIFERMELSSVRGSQ